MEIRRIIAALAVLAAVTVGGVCVWTLNDMPEGIPVLAYHKIGMDGDTYSVEPEEFERQLQYLSDQGYNTVSLLDIAKARKGKLTLPDKPLVLTFDDGYKDNLTTALPLLQRYGMTATVFMVANEIDKKGYLSLEDLRELERCQIELGSHTANHLPLTSLSPAARQDEVYLSKLLMEWKGLKTIFFLSYPNGKYDEACPELLRRNEYLGAVTGHCGLNTMETDPYLLRRINIPAPLFGLTEFKLRLLRAYVYAKLGW